MSRTPPARSKTGPARYIIADDHDIARAGVISLLASERDLALAGEAGNGREAVELCRREYPDLALLDMRMPEMDGLSATRAIKQLCPATSVIIVTMYEQAAYLLEALKAGAVGCVLKDSPRQELLNAVRATLRGDAFLNGVLTTRLVQQLGSESRETAALGAQALTERQIEVLRLLTQGKTNPEIARLLVISPGTVKIHVENILNRLGVSDRTQAAVRAVELGLLDPSTPRPAR